MEIRQLEYFLTIAQEGTFSQAARRLHMTQPPLSYQIRLLEEELGTPLLVRGARKVTLTDAGKLLYARADAILRLKKRIKEEINDLIQGERGEIRLGIVSSAEDLFVRDFLAPYLREHAGVQVRITDADTDQMIDYLRSDLLDAAVIRTPFDGREMDKVTLKRQRLCAAVSRRLLEGEENGGEVTFSSLRDLPLITYQRWQGRIEDAFARTGRVPEFAAVAGDGRTCVSLARHGLGWAILPESCIPEGEEELKAFPLSDPVIETDICVVSRQKAYCSAAARGLLMFLRERAEETG